MTDNTETQDESTTPTPKPTSDGPQRLGAVLANQPFCTEWERSREHDKIQRWHENFTEAVGKRYRDVKLSTFSVSSDEKIAAIQNEVLGRLRKLADNMRPHVTAGGNLIIFGPPGTGKDHLLVAMLKIALYREKIHVSWNNGQDLFGKFRDNIEQKEPESELVRQFTWPHILAISDPVPPKGEASAWGTSMLYRILDARYRQMKSTWVTVNVATKKDAQEQLSGPIFDRLIDNAVTVFCNWPSYRETNKPEWLK